MVDGQGKRRSIGQVGIDQVLHGQLALDGHGGGGDLPADISWSDALVAEQALILVADQHFRDKEFGAHKARFVGTGIDHRLVVGQAHAFGGFLGKPGGYRQKNQKSYRCRYEMVPGKVTLVAENDIFSCCSTFEVGEITHRGKDRLAADPTGDFDTVTGGIDIGVRGLHKLVDRNSAEFAGFEAGSLGEIAVGAHADRHDGKFAVNNRAVREFNAGEFAVLADKFLDTL